MKLHVPCRKVTLRYMFGEAQGDWPTPCHILQGFEEVHSALLILGYLSGVFSEDEMLVIPDAQEDRMRVR